MWLCGEFGTLSVGPDGPAEPLIEGVDEVVAMLNGLEVQSQDVCTQEYTLAYHVVIDYPDGQRVLRGELHGCQNISDDSTYWQGGAEVLTNLIARWQGAADGAAACVGS